MDDAFSRFEADLAHVGRGAPPPPHMGHHGPPPGMHHPMMGMPPQGGGGGGYPGEPGPGPYMQQYGAGPSQPYYAQPPVMHQAPRPMGTIAAMRANQGLPVSGDHHYDPDHGVPPMPKGMGDKKQQQKGDPGTGPDGLPRKGVLREAAGKRWRDPTLDEWPENDFRIFVGDLGNDVNDDALAKAFQKYPSFAKAKIVKDKRTKKTKGFGFISFTDSNDYAKALKEMQGKYIGNRPVKLRKSTWDERNPDLPPPKKKQQKQQQKS